MSSFFTELVRGGFTIISVAIGGKIAIGSYFRQKEYELIKGRYLENAVDVVSAELERALGVLSHNWARALHVAKAYRDSGALFDLDELGRGFLPLESNNFERVANHRIAQLISSQVVWEAFQSATAHATNANSVIVNEVCQAIRLHHGGKLPTAIPLPDFVDQLFVELERIDEKSHKFAALTLELSNLGHLLETADLRFKDLAKFHSDRRVRDLVERLNSAFKTDG